MGSTCCAPFPIWRLFEGEIKGVYVLLKGNKTIYGGNHIKTKGTAHDVVEIIMTEIVKIGNDRLNAHKSGTMINKIQGIRVFEDINYDFSGGKS